MLKMIIKSVKGRKWSFLLTMFVCIVSLAMTLFAVYIYENAHFCRNVVENGLTAGTKNTAVLDVLNEISDEEFAEFKDKLLNEKDILSVGEIDIYSGFENSELAKLQCRLSGNDENMLNYIMIDCRAADIYDIPLETGNIKKDTNLSENEFQVYLGSAYKKYYKTGDVIEHEIYKGCTYRFEIESFLKSGTKAIDPETLLSTDSFLDDKCYKKLGESDVVMVCNVKMDSNVMFFTWSDEVSLKDIKTQINKIADLVGIDAVIGTIDNILNEKLEASRKINDFVNDILWIVMITTIIMLTCTQISVVLTNLSEYGILCANGFSIPWIAAMLIVENSIKIILSGICSSLLFHKLLDILFAGVGSQSDVCREIFIKNVIPANCIICILIILVSSAVPVFVLMNRKTSTLIGGNDT
ncbi:MAG: hypothetical protein K2M60_10275 [Lachnospiraceae bacterium]|nr:hypothetical protein [Lachnospiraceae bacterium]MDE6251656.1 hypothetical protein [Lachnospiraceae bacterium]